MRGTTRVLILLATAAAGTVTVLATPATAGTAATDGSSARTVVTSAAHARHEAYTRPPHVTLVAAKVKTAAGEKAAVGDRVTLRWHTKNAGKVRASGDWSGIKKPKGTATVTLANRGKNLYKLTVRNAIGVVHAKVKIMAARPAKTLVLKVTDQMVMTGADVDITASGLDKGEEYTIRLDDKSILTGEADDKGTVAATYTLPKTTASGERKLTITGSNPRRVGSAVLDVAGAAKFDVTVASATIGSGMTQTVIATGLMPGETVSVMYLGKKVASGKALDDGSFSADFPVGTAAGKHTVKVVGADPTRAGEATFKITG